MSALGRSVHPQPETLADVPLVARERLFGNPERGRCSISPCGRWLAFSAPLHGVMNLWICARDADLSTARPLTQDRHRGVPSGTWTWDGEHVLYQQDQDGNELHHVYAVSVHGGGPRDLTPWPDVRSQLHATSRRHPGAVLVEVHDRDPSFADVYRIELGSGERTLVQHNPGFAGFVTDDDYVVRLALAPDDEGGLTLMRPQEPGSWAPWLHIAPEDVPGTYPLHVSADGRHLFMLDCRHHDTSALTRLDLRADQPDPVVLAWNPRADVGGTVNDLDTHHPLACLVDVEKPSKQVLDERIRADFDFLDRQGIGEWFLGDRSIDNRFWCLHAGGDVQPTRAYLYDREAPELRKLYDTQPQLQGAPLARMQPATLTARDGLEMVCYLTLPLHADVPGEHWVSRHRVPLVLLVHGGPWARDHWGFDAEHQWLANRGYAVLSVNFRGSTGYGKRFVNAGDLEWGARMDDDLQDAVDQVIDRGIADPARLAIMGASYGGYAALWGLTAHPQRYACGVDIVGPSNLETLLASLPAHWESARAMLYRQVGDPGSTSGRQLLRDRSPLHRAHAIQRPLLIGQGANDPRVKKAEADQMAAAMVANGIPVTYALYPDEGHGFVRPANRIAFNVIVERFLARHLGGRFEPSRAEEIAGHSTVMVHGQDDGPQAG